VSVARLTSPYLRQHAENPVDWYPWGEEAFRRAREEEFAHLLAAQDFAQRGPFEIILAGDKLGADALVEAVHRACLPTRVLAFAEDVPIGQGPHPVDGQPAAYVCRNRTCDAPVMNPKALLELCAA